MPRLLLVSHFFPPRYSTGGKRAHRFARYLGEQGWQTTVLAAPAPPNEPLDPSYDDAQLEACSVVRELPSAERVGRVLAKSGADGTAATPTRLWGTTAQPRGFERLRAAVRLRWPVGSDVWIIPWVARTIASVARSSAAEAIFATGAPWSTLVAASVAARRIGLPLVVDLRDPWSFGPKMDRLAPVMRWVERKAESSVLRTAQHAVVTSETTRIAYRELFAGLDVRCIRTGYDPATRIEPHLHDRLTLLHSGNCYGYRSLAPFIEALARFVQRRGLTPNEVQLLNLGRVAQADLGLAERLGVLPFFHYRPFLPYDESLGWVAGADLALMPSFGEAPWFIPGKLYDYLLCGTPIVNLGGSEELASLIADAGMGWTHTSDDIAGLVARFEAAYERRRVGGGKPEPDAKFIEELSSRQTTRQLAALLHEAIGLASPR